MNLIIKGYGEGGLQEIARHELKEDFKMPCHGTPQSGYIFETKTGFVMIGSTILVSSVIVIE